MNNKWMTWLFFFFPIFAFADTSSMSLTPPATDISVIYLENIFGIVDGVLHGTGSQMVGALFMVFNSGILVLGGIVVMYIIIVSTMLTAQDGEFLGKKWSSIWVPLRATIGLTLLIPKSSGYCMMQVFVMWIVVQGVGLADKIWAEALDYLNKGGVIIAANMNADAILTSDQGKIADGGAKIFYGQVCMYGLEKQLEAQRESYLASAENDSGPCAGTPSSTMQAFCDTSVPDFLATVDTMAAYNANPSATSFSVLMPNFEQDSMYSSLNGMCGKIVWNPVDTTSVQDDPNTPENEGISTLTESDIEEIESSRAMAIQTMYNTLATAARSIVNNDPQIVATSTPSEEFATPIAELQFGVPYQKVEGSESPESVCLSATEECPYWGEDTRLPSTSTVLTGTEYQDALADYNGVMASTVNLLNDAENSDQANAAREFIDDANESGWILAGSYYFNLVQLNGNAADNMSETDSNTGLEKSEFDTAALTSPFDSGKCTGQYANLCEWFNKDSTKVSEIVSLIDGSGVTTTLTQPDVQSDPSSITQLKEGAQTCTAYGYINNGHMMDLPDQAGLESPTTVNFNPPAYINFDLSAPSLNVNDACQKYNLYLGSIKICWGNMTQSLYDALIKPFLNWIIESMEYVANKFIFLLIYVPLYAFATLFQGGVDVIGQEGVNPIVALGKMGMGYINFTMTFMMVMVVSSVPASIFGPFWSIVMISAPLVAAWLTFMMGIGFMTAYYIPFLPYMLFTFASIGWFMAVIEAMVAAPLVALGISHPEGHDALGKGEQGFMILLNVFLRPGLMVIGYLIAIALSYVGVWLINAGYQNVLNFLQSEDFWGATSAYNIWSNIFGYFFGAFIYTMMYLTIVEKSFGLIASLPDEILTYIGGQASNKGRETQQWAEGVKTKAGELGKSMGDGGAQSARKATGAVLEIGASAVNKAKAVGSLLSGTPDPSTLEASKGSTPPSETPPTP
ncbi:MAG: type IVB secretion system protein DotA [Legionellaceae bacterium]